MKEDNLTNKLIEWQKSEAENPQILNSEIEPEAHYNNYGSRGFLDLFVRKEFGDGRIEDHLFNIKSSPNTANEVIRQCRKELNNFYENRRYSDKVRFELCFLPTKRNYEHILENKPMYKTLKNSYTYITFRHPKDIRPIHLFTPAHEIGDEAWTEYARRAGTLEFDILDSGGAIE